MTRGLWLSGVVAGVLAAAACTSSSVSSPAAPVPPAQTTTAAADGSTLKATAPVPQSPPNGTVITQGPVVLTVANASTPNVPSVPLSYRFEVSSIGGVAESVLVPAGSGAATARTVGAPLTGNQTYQWRARAEYQGLAGPWSASQTFVAPVNTGYIRGNELYDPLNDGKTIGQVNGSVTFIPGVGARIETIGSWIAYQLPVTLTDGEFSILFTNVTIVPNDSSKRRLITMRQGDFEFNDNPYRMSVGVDSNGEIDWRLIPGGSPYIQTEGDAQRPTYNFNANLTYFLQATWHNNFFHVVYKEGGVNGTTVYDFGKNYVGTYNPVPHNVYIGSPYEPGDRGERASTAGAIVRQVWVSPNPRPAFADQ